MRHRAHRSTSLVLSALLASAVPGPVAHAAADTARTIHVPTGWEGAYDFGYAPVVRVGNQVIVSGVPAGGEGTYEEKIRRMYQLAIGLLTEAGATVEDVVELSTFHREAKDSATFRAEFERYIKVHREFFGEHRPAWTAVGTAALLSATAPVEMRILAVIGSGADSKVVRGKSAPPEAEKPAPPAEPQATTAQPPSGGTDLK